MLKLNKHLKTQIYLKAIISRKKVKEKLFLIQKITNSKRAI